MSEKLLYSADEVQNILKKAIQATSKGIFEFINNESLIVDKLHKIEILAATLETSSSLQNKVSEYINLELSKVGIIYNKF
ncbi:hypothetical protein [Chryseobacterium gambrini]|uniref:hypothetical protein n=1 Tax=Chryseobacterium gambrini TaxID=373672 RepID=UPI0022F3967A|nr:hypothetical protein [Chryseobacterium gambrini]WBX97993.1 hypothetical protein PE065_01770 [Chryseobacterium gambrini]